MHKFKDSGHKCMGGCGTNFCPVCFICRAPRGCTYVDEDENEHIEVLDSKKAKKKRAK